jgi:hypothetical protein
MAWRHLVDVPPVTPQVTEHQLITLRCRCGHRTTAAAPPEATAPMVYGPRLAGIGVYLLHGQFLSVSRTAAALKDLFGAPVAAGTVAGWVKRTALGIIDKVLPVIAGRITNAPGFDETGMRVAGRLAWMHFASTATDVLLAVHIPLDLRAQRQRDVVLVGARERSTSPRSSQRGRPDAPHVHVGQPRNGARRHHTTILQTGPHVVCNRLDPPWGIQLARPGV